MDTTDAAIEFDAQGVCDHCRTFFKQVLPNWHPDQRGENELMGIVGEMKKDRANKDFDLVIAPNRNHGLNEPYFIRRRWDYFVRYLMGAEPPKEYEIEPAPQGQGGPGGGPDDDCPNFDAWAGVCIWG